MYNTKSCLYSFIAILSLCLLITILNQPAECAVLELSVKNTDNSPVAGMVFQVFPGIAGVDDAVDSVKVGGTFWKDDQAGYVTGQDGKISLNLQDGIYTIVGFSQERHLLLAQEVSAPGSFTLNVADAIPVSISCRAADNSPIPGAEIFFRPTKRAKGSLGYANNDGLLNARISTGKYHAVLRAVAGNGPHYLILPNQAISQPKSGETVQVNFHVSELPTSEIRFNLPNGTAIAIFEILESAYTIEYAEGVEPEIGYDAAYTDFYPFINTFNPCTLSANVNYNFNMSFAVLFGSGTIYAYELRPSAHFIQPGDMRIGVTEKDKFSFFIRAEPKGKEPVYQPGDKVDLYYQCENSNGDKLNRILNYSEARLIFPMVTILDPNGVSIANNYDTDKFYDFSFDLPRSAIIGDYKAEISLDAGIYGKITSSFPFRVATGIDSEPPHFASLNFPETSEAGNDIIITANITDNFGVADDPILRFSMDSGLSWAEIPMTTVERASLPVYEGENSYKATIPWNSLGVGELSWQIIAKDQAGNKAQRAGVISIVDTSPPVITHTPPASAELGTKLRIQAEIADNVKVKEASVIYSSDRSTLTPLNKGGEGGSNAQANYRNDISMIRSGNSYIGHIPASEVTFAGVSYSIQAVDTTGNIANTESIKVGVKDTLPPAISHKPVSISIANTPIMIEAIITDNSQIISAEVFYRLNQDFKSTKMGNAGGFYRAEIPATSVVPGNLQYYIVASDGRDPDGQVRTARSPGNGYYQVEIRSEPYTTLTSLKIEPQASQTAPIKIPIGESFSFKVMAQGLAGETIPADVIWTVIGGIGYIDQDGVFIATGKIVSSTASIPDRLYGIGKIIATAKNLSPKGDIIQAETWVQVSPGEPASIILNPNSVTIPAGSSQKFFVKVTDIYSNIIENYNTINWRVDSNIGTIRDGVFTGSKAGSGRIIATLGNIQAACDVTVTPGQLQKIAISTSSQVITAGNTAMFFATGYDAFDNQIPIAPVWSVRGGVGTIQSYGLFRGGTAGNGMIVATMGDVSASVNVKVVPGRLANLTISPYNTYLPVSTADSPSTQQFVADGWDVAGNPVPLKSVVWATDALAGTISSTGLFTAVTDPGIRVGEIVTNGSIWATGTSATGAKVDRKSTVVIQKSPADRLISINVIVQGTSGESASVSLATGESLQFEAVGSDAKGRRIFIDPSWSVEGGIGEADVGGFFTAMTAGSGSIIATAGGLTGKLGIQVTPGSLKSIALKPEMLILNSGSQSVITAVGYDSFGNVVPTQNLRWSADSDFITIQPDGDKCLVLAQKPKKSGYSTISATSGDLLGFATILVPYADASLNFERATFDIAVPYYLEIKPEMVDLKVGSQQQFTVREVDILGNNRQPGNLAWNVVGNIGQISDSGLFKALNKGSGRVIATDGQKVATALVNVSDSDTKTGQLIIIPSQLSLVSGALQEFAAFVKSDSRLIPVMPAWRVIGNVGNIDSTGHFVATKAGDGEVEAITGSLRARCQINVSSGRTEKVQLQPESLSIRAGKQQNYKVISQDSSDNLTDSKPEYYVAGNLGKIDEKGIFSAVKTGTGNIIAAVSSIVSKGDVEVTPESLTEIRISPAVQEVTAGTLTKFSAFGKDAYGNLIPINPVWEVIGTPGVGSISSSGLFMAKKTGQCQVQAKVSDIAHTAAIQVLASAPAFILVEPALLSISSKNDSPVQFLFKILDRFGNIPDSKNIQISWTATAGIGTIDPQTGLFINKKNETRAGYVTATAVINKGTETERTIRGRAAVMLLPATKPLASITVTPNPATVIKGDTRKFTATGRDADGIEVFITPSWSVTNSDGLQSIPNAISSDGIFKATPDMGVDSSWKVLASAANSEGQLIKGEAKLNLVAGPLQSIEVVCSNNSLKSGKIIQMEAAGYDQFRNNVAISPEWKVTGDIGTVSPATSKNKASFTAGKAGQGEVIASSDGKEGRIHLTVEPGDLAGIKISTEPALPDTKIGSSESNPLNIKSGSEIRFIATGQDSSVDDLGKTKPVNTFQISPAWSLKKIDESIDLGTLAADGRFTGRKTGNGRIEAKIESITATFYIRVTPGDLKTIKVSPSSLSIISGAVPQQFSVLGYDAYGNQISNPGDVTWRIIGNIGHIDKNGLFTPVSLTPEGVAISGTVIASISGIESGASVTIVPSLGKLSAIHVAADPEDIPAGSQSIITIRGVDEDGHPMTDFPPSVQITLSVPESLGTITPSSDIDNEWIFQAQRVLPVQRDGLITANAKTEGETLTDSIAIKLVPGLLSKIAIEPESAIIPAGEDRTFEASGYDQWGNQIELVSPEWSLSNSLGQLVQDESNPQEAIFTANTAGQSQLIVRFQNQEGRADLTVTPGKLETLTIEPTDLTISAGSSHSFVSLGLDGYGNEVENLNLQWEIISDINIGTVTDDGVFSALKSGTGKLKATYKSGNIVVNSDEARIQVIPGPITSADIVIYKDGIKLETPYVLLSGVQYDLRLQGVDQWGNIGDQIENVDWNVKSDTGAAIISDNPAIFATLFTGNAQITAKIGEITVISDLKIAPHSHSITSAKGGTVSGPYGSIMKIPPGALSADETISIALSPSPGPAESAMRISHVYSFAPDGKVFNLPVELLLSYANQSLVISTEIDPERLSIYSYDKFSGKWVRVGGKINQESITANINYLSYFAIMQEDQGSNEPLDNSLKILDVQLSPNAFFAPETNRLNIRYNINLTKRQVVNVTVEIYDIKGHLVKQLLEKSPKYSGWNADQWDGTDESGEIVKNGRYFVLITAEIDNDKVSMVKHLAVFR